MNVTQKELPKSQVELTFELSIEEVKPYLEKAAKKISNEKEFPGFRKGKATYEVVKQNLGEMAIYQRALDLIVMDTYFKEVEKRKLETIGYPQIDIEKMAPKNPLIYKAIASLLPKVELCDYKSISIEKKKVEIDDEKVDTVLQNLRKMQAKEALVERAAEKNDKVEVNFNVFQDKVPIEHGAQKNYPLTIGEGKMIPGFEDNLIGMKARDKKTFELEFPKDYHNKQLQNKKCEFEVEVLSVYKVDLPELNEDFAKTLGMENIDKTKEQIKKNLLEEAVQKENQRLEIEMLEKLVEKSKFDDLPEKLINSEIDKMMHELESNVAQQGMKLEDYLTSIKKDIGQLKIDFTPQAIKRVKLAILTREVSKQEKIEVKKEEVEEELNNAKEMHKDNPEVIKNLENENYKTYIANILANRKVVDLLKGYIIK